MESIPSSLTKPITDHTWTHLFDAQRLNRGRLINKRKEVTLYSQIQRSNLYQFDFNVKGSSIYEVEIILSKDHSPEVFCDCPDLNYCKHIAASFYYLADYFSHSLKKAQSTTTKPKKVNQSQIDSWISSLTDSIEKGEETDQQSEQGYFTEKQKDRVVYVLSTNFPDRIYLKAQKGRILKDGSYRISQSSVRSRLDRYNKPNYVSPVDFEIICAMQSSNNNYYLESAITSETPLFYQLLEQCANIGRLFFAIDKDTNNYTPQPLAFSSTRTILPNWMPSKHGALKPAVSMHPPADIVLPSSPKIYIDTENHQIGYIEQNHPDEFFSQWLNGPEILASDLKKVQKSIAAAQTENDETLVAQAPGTTTPKKKASIPAPPKTVSLSDLTPTPKLVVQRVEGNSTEGLFANAPAEQILVGKLSFYYKECSIDATETGTEFHAQDDNVLYIIQRNLSAEQQYIDLLESHKLDTLLEVTQNQNLHLRHFCSFLFSSQDSLNTLQWLRFLTDQREAFEKLGWTIETVGELGYTVQEYDDIYQDLEESENDWFRFDLGIEFEGKRISLIPALAAAIASGMYEGYEFPEGPDARIPIPITQGIENHFINFPAERFKLILDKVQDLFQHINEDGEVKMPRLRAATLADDMDLAKVDKTLADLAEMGKQLRNVKGLPKTRVPKNLKAELRDYQVEGFRWLQFLAKYKLHGVLADDMGLGKTLQTLTHILAEKNSKRNKKLPTLVIAPTSVIPNWRSEAAKFTPSLSVLLLHGNERKELFEQISSHDIVITSYSLLQRDELIHTKQDYHIAVLDESQYIKNFAAKTTKIAYKLNANHRICLSGTPMENHLGELWSTFNFLMPGLLQSRENFNTLFRRPIEKEESSAAQTALQRRVSPLLLRRTKDVVVKELPPKTHIPHHITLNQEQVDLYESVRATMDKRVRDAIKTQGFNKSQIIILDALLKLRQICCHPQLLKLPAAQKIQKSAKLDYLTNLLETLIEEKRHILIFSQFTTMLSMIEKHLKKEKIPFVKITGATRDRQTPVEKFQSGEIPVFLISLKAGGTGLNLTAADTVIHYDPWWNPAAENQATDRAYRIGQKNPVFVHKLICQGTIEEHIQQLQEKKAKLVESLLSGSTNKLKLDQSTLTGLLAPLDV